MGAFVPFFVSQACTDWFNGLKGFAAGRGLDPDNLSQVFGILPDWEKENPLPRATISQVADHIEHVREVAGVAGVGIGADFDGTPILPDGLQDVSRYPALFAELRDRRWSEADLRALAGGNILRALRGAEDAAASS
jgi:membrane dipeptidase